MPPFGFDSVYGNGGQNATYTSRFGGGGGGGRGGGGGGINAQMQAMSSFDPAAYLNVAQQNAYQRDRDLFSRGESVKQADRKYAEDQATAARNRASSTRAWRGLPEDERKPAFQPVDPRHQQYQNWLNQFQRGQTAAQRATSLIAGQGGQSYGDMTRQLAALAAAGIPIADYTGMTELAKAGAGASAAAEQGATQLKTQRNAQDYNDKWRR